MLNFILISFLLAISAKYDVFTNAAYKSRCQLKLQRKPELYEGLYMALKEMNETLRSRCSQKQKSRVLLCGHFLTTKGCISFQTLLLKVLNVIVEGLVVTNFNLWAYASKIGECCMYMNVSHKNMVNMMWHNTRGN